MRLRRSTGPPSVVDAAPPRAPDLRAEGVASPRFGSPRTVKAPSPAASPRALRSSAVSSPAASPSASPRRASASERRDSTTATTPGELASMLLQPSAQRRKRRAYRASLMLEDGASDELPDSAVAPSAAAQLSPVYVRLFAEAARVEAAGLRLHALHSLVYSLPVATRAELVARLERHAADVGLDAATHAVLAESWPQLRTGRVNGLMYQPTDDGATMIVSCGTTAALLEKLLDRFYDLNEPDYVESFVTAMLPYVSTEAELLGYLRERYEELAGRRDEPSTALRRRVLHVLHSLLLVPRRFSPDFVELLSDFRMTLHEDEADHEAQQHVLAVFRFGTGPTVADAGSPAPGGSHTGFVVHSFLKYSPEEWAAALTVAAHAAFKSITMDEMCMRRWESSPGFGLMGKLFVRWQLWAATQVVQTSDAREQLDVLDALIRLAHTLVMQLRNFHAGFAVFAGVNMNPITRLKGLWARVPAARLAQLKEVEALFNPSRNQAAYQTALEHALATARTPVVPALGFTQKWLFMIEEANPNKQGDGLWNLLKFRMVAQICQRIDVLQHSGVVPMTAPDLLARFVQHIPLSQVLDEEALYALSLQREPRSGDTPSVGRSSSAVRTGMTTRLRSLSFRDRRSSSTPPPVLVAPPLAATAADSETDGPAVAEESSVVIRASTCPACMRSFQSKERLLLHLSSGQCGGDN